jgi:hypothetical protein
MNKAFDRHISNIVFILSVLSYFQFFSFTFIPFTYRIVSQIFFCALMLLLIIVKIIYMHENGIKMNFATPLLFLILGSFPCYFIAKAYHNQNFAFSFFANRLIWFYLLYFFAHFYKIRPKLILGLIICIGLFSVFLYYLQLAVYPKILMDINIIKGRGTIRLFVGGMICAQMAYFYFLSQFFAKNNLFYLFLCLLILSIYILQGTRIFIFAFAFLTFINLLFSKRIRSKFLMAFVLSLAIFSLFFIFREIFTEINRVSNSQVQYLAGGVRLKAARFYLTTFMPHPWAYIFGNSAPGFGSAYSLQMDLYAYKYGFYLADIGLLGDYIKYGLIFTLAGIALLIKVLRFKISDKYSFLKYYIFSQCMTLITGFGIFGGADIVLILILYIFDVNRTDNIQTLISTNKEDILPKKEFS